MGRWVIMIGVAITVIGIIMLVLEKLGIGLGRLPGDISLGGRNWKVYFPIATCIILSAVLTLILWLVSRLMRK